MTPKPVRAVKANKASIRRAAAKYRKSETFKEWYKRRRVYNKTYYAWCDARKRCSRPKDKRYNRYGGRGIRMCARWAHSFDAFLADMGFAPLGMTLDRINNDGDYEPGNCRWTTKIEQERNTSRTRFITFNGETRCLIAWAHHLGINSTTLWSRLRAGWPLEKAMTSQLFGSRVTK